MTFTEAAIEVLRREGKPLHFKKLTEIAVQENLLDHIGKIPEDTMADQLAAHCRLPRAERRVIPVQQGTFALVEWGIDEDPSGLENLIEAPPEGELPYRGRERHPIPSRDLARGIGRGEARARRRDEEERRGRRFPPPAEVAYEILAGSGRPLALGEIATMGADRFLMPDAFVRDTGSLRAALAEDNRRRESSGRKALFEIDGETVTLVAQPEPGEHVAAPQAARGAGTLQDIRWTALGALRRRLRECDGPTLEYVALRLLEKLAFRDVKVAKRGREHVVCTGKRRLGLADIRHAVRILRSGADASRRDIVDLRRDLGHYAAQIGVVVTPGDATRDARGEATSTGQAPVMLLCGDALAEALADAGVGCVPVVVPDVDEAFFRSAAAIAERDESARRARREERERRESARREEAPAPAPAEGTEGTAPAERDLAVQEPGAAPVSPGAAAEPEPAEGLAEEEGPEDEDVLAEGERAEASGTPAAAAAEGEPGAAAGERRRRRRRRRRRGGRGRGSKEGQAPGAAPAGGAPSAPAPASSEASSGEPPAAPASGPPEPPSEGPREPTGGEGG